MNVLRSFVVCWCFVFYSSPTEAVPTFEETPADVTAQLGESVTLTCTIANKENYHVFWIIEPDNGEQTIALGPDMNRNAEIYSGYTFNGDAETGQYNLQIAAVGYDDMGQYTCFIQAPSNEPEDNMEASATLTANPPSPPECSSTNLDFGLNAVNREGTLAGLTCTATGVAAHTTVNWLRNGEPMPGQNQTSADDGQGLQIVMSTVQWELSSLDSHAAYTCETHYQGWPEPIRCVQTFEDLYLEFSPVVMIYPPWQKIEKNYPAMLYCNATAEPSECTFTWIYKGVTVTDENPAFNVTLDSSHSTLTFLAVSSDDYLQDIICNATNLIGSNANTAIIIDPAEEEKPERALSFEYMLIIVVVVIGVLFLVVLLVTCCLCCSKERRKNDPNRQDGYTLNEVDGGARHNDGIDYNQFQGGAESRIDQPPNINGDSVKENNPNTVEQVSDYLYATPDKKKGSTRSESSSIEDNTEVTPDDVEISPDHHPGGHVIY